MKLGQFIRTAALVSDREKLLLNSHFSGAFKPLKSNKKLHSPCPKNALRKICRSFVILPTNL